MAQVKYEKEKQRFAANPKAFAGSLAQCISQDNDWTIRGFVDIFGNVCTISSDTKIVSKVLELHLFPQFLSFAERIGYAVELAGHQNWYPDLTFIAKDNADIKFAVDLKTTYRIEHCPAYCNGFTLGSHGAYFVNRTSTKNIQYPYGSYSGHFCLGIIYTRRNIEKEEELRAYRVDEIESIPAVIGDFLFFAEEKWKIASDKRGSGNTANIGSIQRISDIITGNGVFAKAGEALFDDDWANYGKMEVPAPGGGRKKLTSFAEYLEYWDMPANLNNPRPSRRGLS